jgi:hypothetical protein
MLKRIFAVISVGLFALALFLPFWQVQSPVSAAPLVSAFPRFRVVIAESLGVNANLYLDGSLVTSTSNPTATPPTTPSAMVIASYNTSGYVATTAGSHTISLTQDGTTTGFTGVSPFTFSPAAGTNYTVVLLPGNTWITIVDGNVAPVAGTVNARVLNFSSANNPVTVDVDGTAPAAFTAIPYQGGNSATSIYANFSAATHTLTIPGSNATAKSFSFLDGHVYSIFIFDNTSSGVTVILPKSDTNFLAGVTPTATLPPATSTSLPTATSTPIPTETPTVIPTVGATTTVTPGSLRFFLPVIQD